MSVAFYAGAFALALYAFLFGGIGYLVVAVVLIWIVAVIAERLGN